MEVMPAFALHAPLIPSQTPSGAFSRCARAPPQPLRARRRTRLVARLPRVDPRDEAFATCPSCGSDTAVSARRLTRAGEAPVRCGECGASFTARAEDALTVTGAPLGDAPRDEADDDARAAEVRLFVGGLAPRTDAGALREEFEAFGDVVDAAVVRDRVTGRSRGFGFVTVGGRAAARAAVDALSGGASRLGQRVSVREAGR